MYPYDSSCSNFGYHYPPSPTFQKVDSAIHQAPVVQTLDSATHRINISSVDGAIGFPHTYPLDSDLSDG